MLNTTSNRKVKYYLNLQREHIIKISSVIDILVYHTYFEHTVTHKVN